MSVADHFDHSADHAFVRGYDSGSAKRQLNLSVVIFALFLAACALFALVRFETPDTSSSAPSIGAPPPYAGHL